ncbi:MAG: Trk system potassium transporter TrkA [Bacteroidales bacterium]|nr:Trk system potassium transporter TrkA [Bacteroidales bacterium]
MKIVIAGAGEVGSHLAKMLINENHDIVVIDPDEKNLKGIENLDLLTIQGSATSLNVLKEANIKKADLFIAVTYSEDTNITSAMLGKKLGAKKSIARIDNKEYLFPSNKEFFESMGIDYLIYPENIAVRELVNLVTQAGTADFFDFSGGKLSLYVLRLGKDAPLINKTIKETTNNIDNLEYRAVAITRNNETIIPRGNEMFKLNDVIYVISNQSGIKELMELSGKEQLQIKNIMILGGSRIGIGAANQLENKYNVKLVEQNKEKCFKLAGILNNTLIINGDGRNLDLLSDEGLRNMDAFIAVTGNSETNILSCLLAKQLGVKRTIAEIENIDYIHIAESMGIDTIINKKLITAGRISRFTRSAEVSDIKCLTGTDAEVVEFIAQTNSKITKGKLNQIDFPKDSIVGGFVRGESSFIATGNTQIQANDKVVVFALPKAFEKLEKFFN